jgi:DNA-binding MarR family transcriptional regulator
MEKGKLTIGQLSSVLMVTNATVSGHIDNLEKLGIVSRVRSEKDRRIVNVEVNEEFAMKMKGESEEVHDSFNKLFEDLTKEEVNKIFIGLDILERTLEGGNDDETN